MSIHSDQIFQKAGKLTLHFLPDEALKLRRLFQTCGEWSNTATEEVAKREVLTRLFAFSTVPMAALYSLYFFARGLLHAGACILHGRFREASSLAWKESGKALRCLVLTVTNIAYALLGLAFGHEVFKHFIPHSLEKVDEQALILTWEGLKDQSKKLQEEIQRLNDKTTLLKQEHLDLEHACDEECQMLKKYKGEVVAKKNEVERYHTQIRELELALSSLNAAAALKKDIAELQQQLEHKNKELEENLQAIQASRLEVDKLAQVNRQMQEDLYKFQADYAKIKQNVEQLQHDNALLKDKENQLQKSLEKAEEKVADLIDQLEEVKTPFYDAEDRKDFEIPPVVVSQEKSD